MLKDIKVTSLENKKDNYIVHFSNGESAILKEDEVVKYRLVKGKDIDITTYEEIIENITAYEAYYKAIRYYNMYFKSSHDIYLYLLDKGYSKDVSRNVLDMLDKNNIIDDTKYKEYLIEKYVSSSYGRLMIEQKLKSHGLTTDFEIDLDIYYKELEACALKKLKTLKDNKEIRLKKYLLQRGYLLSEINEVIRGIKID